MWLWLLPQPSLPYFPPPAARKTPGRDPPIPIGMSRRTRCPSAQGFAGPDAKPATSRVFPIAENLLTQQKTAQTLSVLTHDTHHHVAHDGDDQQDAADNVRAAPASGKKSVGDTGWATALPKPAPPERLPLPVINGTFESRVIFLRRPCRHNEGMENQFGGWLGWEEGAPHPPLATAHKKRSRGSITL